MSKFISIIALAISFVSIDASAACAKGWYSMDSESCLDLLNEPGTVKVKTGWRVTLADGQGTIDVVKNGESGCCGQHTRSPGDAIEIEFDNDPTIVEF